MAFRGARATRAPPKDSAEPREIGRGEAAVGLHAEEHWDGFIDGEAINPVVRTAPGGKGCDGERHGRWHAAAEIAQERGVEIALKRGVNDPWSLNADNRDAGDAGRIGVRLAARSDGDGAAEEQGAVEGGDCRGLRIERAEVLGTFPDPESSGGERIHPAGGRGEIGNVRADGAETTGQGGVGEELSDG